MATSSNEAIDKAAATIMSTLKSLIPSSWAILGPLLVCRLITALQHYKNHTQCHLLYFILKGAHTHTWQETSKACTMSSDTRKGYVEYLQKIKDLMDVHDPTAAQTEFSRSSFTWDQNWRTRLLQHGYYRRPTFFKNKLMHTRTMPGKLEDQLRSYSYSLYRLKGKKN